MSGGALAGPHAANRAMNAEARIATPPPSAYRPHGSKSPRTGASTRVRPAVGSVFTSRLAMAASVPGGGGHQDLGAVRVRPWHQDQVRWLPASAGGEVPPPFCPLRQETWSVGDSAMGEQLSKFFGADVAPSDVRPLFPPAGGKRLRGKWTVQLMNRKAGGVDDSLQIVELRSNGPEVGGRERHSSCGLGNGRAASAQQGNQRAGEGQQRHSDGHAWFPQGVPTAWSASRDQPKRECATT